MKPMKTILFLEDEEEFRATVSILLRDLGYNVIEVFTAEKALEMLKTTVPDLIIADIKLPGIDGIDFFIQIHKIDRYRQIPFIYLTAFNNLQSAMKAKADGATDYITKPFELDYLIAKIGEVLPL
jgi:CheY-like chemotaxis protein